ncbi:Holliday junction resolvase RecU [Tumebacillus sp. ITR2]|uniref:Holliday junction resolvase RecU n=1 Tax=Tumebacillus amylolyticus TaxID=2801339 RepID=A0ABS1JC98_9BACL|nr:Holliday junction resolvase RecU [Tumebacillus amylolyticus]MBL0387888.1 Holliday junction resolvase RecU [Tumebacillus amylolyticus]
MTRFKSFQNNANLGKSFEDRVIQANQQYAARGVAVIQKVATPFQIIRKGKGMIAVPTEKSTVDFVGLAVGRGVALDAKTTKVQTNFPLSNVEQHQIDFLVRWKKQGGAAFLLIEFSTLRDEIYRLDVDQLVRWWIESAMPKGRKSIPIDFFRNECPLVRAKNGVVLDYLDFIISPEVA